MNTVTALRAAGTALEPASASNEGRITEASQQFESVLLGQWLEEAESSFGSVPGSGDDDAGGGEMKEFAMQNLATEIVRSGGIGIAKMVDEALAKTQGLSGPGTEASQRPRDLPSPLKDESVAWGNPESGHGIR